MGTFLSYAQPRVWTDSLGYFIKAFEDFPSGPVAKTSPSNAGGVGSIAVQGAKIPHGSWSKTKT